jgi:hypothetical protein
MKRKYAIEDKEVEIEEIEEVLAIKLKTTEKLDFEMDRIGKKIEASMVNKNKERRLESFRKSRMEFGTTLFRAKQIVEKWNPNRRYRTGTESFS